VLHADETPIQVLSPGDKKIKRGYIWAYTPSKFEALKAVIYDFCPSRVGSHALEFLQDWSCTLVVDQLEHQSLATRIEQTVLMLVNWEETLPTRLPTHPNSLTEELFPHNWQPLQN
jgi:hypothetical protein